VHFCPAWQGAPAPHLQVPPLHVSESFGSHATQAAPLPPHAPSEGVVQVFPAQHPLAQLTLQPVQLPPAQASPALQVEHAEPPVPHALGAVPVWQTFAWQQPAQLAALQMHAPATQASPAPHGAFVPHLQLPPLQLSVVRASQLPHVPPPVPQLALLGVLQVLPAQQPVAHDVASHTQAPPTQRWPTLHAAPTPHWQPPAAQLSARVVSQVAQPPPAVPQDVVDGV
jgi:hypothetical protein